MPHLLDDLLGRAAVRQDFIEAPLLQPIRMSGWPLRDCAPFDPPGDDVKQAMYRRGLRAEFGGNRRVAPRI